MTSKNKIILSTPEDRVSIENEIMQVIRQTQFELNVAMYRFLNENILKCIQEKVQEGIKLNMILDTTVDNTDEYYNYFIERIANPLKNLQQTYPDRVKIFFTKDDVVMHHKLLISDRRILITGSYNLTVSAEKKNMENIFIHESDSNEKVMADALSAFFQMMGIDFKPDPLEVHTISVRKGIYIQNVFNSIEKVHGSDIFLIRGMSVSFWIYGKGIFCVKVSNSSGRMIVAANHFLYDTDADDIIHIKVHGTDGTFVQFKYSVKILPWKLPYTEEFKKHLDERFKIFNQKLKYAGLI